MKIQIMSDLHIPHESDTPRGTALIKSFDPTDVDVLVVAGDSCDPSSLYVLQQLADKYPHVVYVPGNHDYYDTDYYTVTNEYQKLSDRVDNLHILQTESVVIDGQRFLGTTLWFSEQPATPTRALGWSDFRWIKDLRAWVYNENKSAEHFLYSEATSGDVIITHHLPLLACTDPIWHTNPDNIFFVHDMEKMIREKRPNLWIYGHTHNPHDFIYADTRLVCNPKGYPFERLPFKRKVVEV